MGGCLSYRLKLVRDQDCYQDDSIKDTLFKNVTRYSIKALKKATDNFSTSSIFEENGFSKSYKATLEDGSVVIVKVFNNQVPDFTSMIKIMSGVRHQNVVELIGYCIEDGHMILVHEFVGDYTLAQLLFSGDVVLDWRSRVSICHGIARGLDYLHNGICPRVVVCDVKPINIHMDCSFNPKITNFDISYLLEDGESHHSGPIAGTLGYLDAESISTGTYSEKTDVYAFGITLLELIHGKTFMMVIQDREHESLVDWALELRESGRIFEIVDTTLSGAFVEDELTCLVNVALSCVQSPIELRPSMTGVRLMLSDSYDFSNMVLERPPRPTTARNSLQGSSVDEFSDISSNKEDTFLTNVTRFSFESLKTATDDFNHSSETRWNGFSRSYKGNLYDRSEIVVKVYSTKDIDIDFRSMIRIMSDVKHENVVKLLGYCIEDDHKMLVHEFAGDYSLDQLLFSDSKIDVVLDWPRRVSICYGVASALDHLHNGVSARVVLRDVKTSNILIDFRFNPKIVDFEISCLLEEGFSDHSDETYGCLDPVYRTTGRYSDKTDVYGFGIILLEIISGSRVWLFWKDHGKTSLVDRALELRESGKILEIVDPTLSEISEYEVRCLVNVALLCVQSTSHLRPSMSEVKLMLSEGYDFSNMELTRPRHSQQC